MRYVVLAAVLASVTVCVALELMSRQKIEQRRAIIEQKQKELQPLANIAAELQAYEQKKGALQRRIDIINQLKQNQRGPVAAIHFLNALDPSPIDSVAIDDTSITINSHAEIKTDAEIVEKRAANGRFTFKVKI
jgi:Tfp pilus assembly protein PilN